MTRLCDVRRASKTRRCLQPASHVVDLVRNQFPKSWNPVIGFRWHVCDDHYHRMIKDGVAVRAR